MKWNKNDNVCWDVWGLCFFWVVMVGLLRIRVGVMMCFCHGYGGEWGRRGTSLATSESTAPILMPNSWTAKTSKWKTKLSLCAVKGRSISRNSRRCKVNRWQIRTTASSSLSSHELQPGLQTWHQDLAHVVVNLHFNTQVCSILKDMLLTGTLV